MMVFSMTGLTKRNQIVQCVVAECASLGQVMYLQIL